MKNVAAKAIALIIVVIIVASAFSFMAALARWERGKPFAVKHEMTSLVSAPACYHGTFGQFPTVNNAQVMRALWGENPKKMMLDPIGPRRRSATNEALDIW